MQELPKIRDHRIRQETNWPNKSTQCYDTELEVTAVTRIGGGSATATTRAMGASGNVVMPVLSFAANVDNDCNFTFHVPEELCPNFPARIRFMWLPGASYTTGNYHFVLDYLVKDEEFTAVNTGTPTTLQYDVSTTSDPLLDAVTLRENEFATDIWLLPDHTITCHFYRDVSEDNGDDVAHVRFFELHYKRYRVGSKIGPIQKPW